jgi:hypothetical protein
MGGGRERGANPPLRRIRAAPAWVAAATGGDRRLHALCHEGGHCAVTRSVASCVGAVTGACGWKPAWAADWWARPGYKFSFLFPI